LLVATPGHFLAETTGVVPITETIFRPFNLILVGLVIAVMSLLAWMPGPATGGAKVFAWLLILWPTLITQIAMLAVGGHVADAIKHSPFQATMEWVPVAAYFVLVGYGLATVIGKQLE
jgi:short subunit fatty acids transporter